jgi:DNA-binding MarR family transcriptional regulator
MDFAVPSKPTMQDQLAYLIASINRQLEEEMSDILKPQGVVIEHFRILTALATSDGRPMRDLASAVLIDPASLTKVIDRMVVEALVFRAPDPNDRRKVLICMASKGKALYERLKILHDAQQHNLVSRLSERKADQLADILRGLMN